MPAQVPQASFLPISPDLNLDELVQDTPNFEYAVRVPYDMIEVQGPDLFEKLVLLHVILGGKPLVIEGLQKRFPPDLFSVSWLRENVGSKCMRPPNQTLAPLGTDRRFSQAKRHATSRSRRTLTCRCNIT